jgi:NAD(P)-dependent dehydrogenase (short-subunit alcohol dehydrogenase family)
MQKKETSLKALDNPKDIFDLSKRIIVIIGGCGKMGQNFAKVLSLSGAVVILADLNPLKEKIAENVHYIHCNASSQESIVQLMAEVIDKFSRIDVLIYNVMAKPKDYYKPFEKYPIEAWNDVMNGNLSGAFVATQEVTKIFKKQNIKGSIILTSSIYGMLGPDQSIYDGSNATNNIYGSGDPLSAPVSYSASKSGLIGLTKYLACFLGEDDIRVNSLIPGGVYDGQDDEFHKAYIKKTPLKRMATWTDFNGAILLLASDASRYMTGTNLIIDGGWSAW